MISEKYKLTHFIIDKICEWARNEKNEFGDEVRKKEEEIEENVNKAIFLYCQKEF